MFSYGFDQLAIGQEDGLRIENIKHSNLQIEINLKNSLNNQLQDIYDGNNKIIEKSLKLSGSIFSNKKVSFRLLAQVASSVPKRVKFKSIDYNGSDLIIIEGEAFSDQDILKLIDNLSGKKLIAQASLASMTLPSQEAGKILMKGFKIACVLENS